MKDNFGISVADQLSNGPFVKWDALEQFAITAIERFEIKCNSPEQLLRELSGGNIQKVLVAREFGRDVDVLIAVHPAKGLDLHTTYLVYKQILEIKRGGVSVLLVAEDVDEVIYIADRIGVMYEGQLSEVKPKQEWTRQAIGSLMTGAQVKGGTQIVA